MIDFARDIEDILDEFVKTLTEAGYSTDDIKFYIHLSLKMQDEKGIPARFTLEQMKNDLSNSQAWYDQTNIYKPFEFSSGFCYTL